MTNTKIKREGLAFWLTEYRHATETEAYGVRRDSGWLPVSKLAPGQRERANQVLPANDPRFYGAQGDQAFIVHDGPVLPGDVVPAEAFISTPHFLATMTDTTADVDRLNVALKHSATWGGNTLSFYEAVDRFVSRLNACGMSVEVRDRGYTYNQDNNFTSDFEYIVIRDTDWNEDFIVLDRIGGPQLFRMGDESYFYTWNVDFYCEAIEQSFDHIWDFENGGYRGEFETRYVIAEDGVTVQPQARKKDENGEWLPVSFYSPEAG
jgi:hypothetical protein